jgi:Autophagy protein Atg8 ubiquitin like
MLRFKNKYTEEERKKESNRILTGYKDRVPIVIEKASASKLQDMSNAKILCPKTYTFQQLLQGLRSKIKLSKEDAIFVFLNGKELVTGDSTIISIYEQYKDPDGFLYLMYCEHPTLG